MLCVCIMEKYRDSISKERIRDVEKALKQGGMAHELTAVANADPELAVMLRKYLSSQSIEREKLFPHLLEVMRKNAVPEVLVWALTCASAQDTIAQGLLIILEDCRNPNKQPFVSKQIKGFPHKN